MKTFLRAAALAVAVVTAAAQIAFAEKRFDEAERRFREIVEQLPSTDAAPAAQYWTGVAKYKASGDNKTLAATAQAFKAKYAETTWAKKASIWG